MPTTKCGYVWKGNDISITANNETHKMHEDFDTKSFNSDSTVQYQQIHVSSSGYYGYQNINGQQFQSTLNTNLDDCEMTLIPANSIEMDVECTQSRKRSYDDETVPICKRPREEEYVPPVMKYTPRFTRPTHQNADITRCLMGHMI